MSQKQGRGRKAQARAMKIMRRVDIVTEQVQNTLPLKLTILMGPRGKTAFALEVAQKHLSISGARECAGYCCETCASGTGSSN